MKKAAPKGIINDVNEQEIIAALRVMEASAVYLTKAAYRGASERWTDNYVSFVDYHINYLKSHPALNPDQYISNLRLVLKKAQR